MSITTATRSGCLFVVVLVFGIIAVLAVAAQHDPLDKQGIGLFLVILAALLLLAGLVAGLILYANAKRKNSQAPEIGPAPEPSSLTSAAPIDLSSKPLTDNQLVMLNYVKRRGGVQFARGGEVKIEGLPALGTPGEARTLHSLVKRGFVSKASNGAYYITSQGSLALVNSGRF
jgi:hypothetical protein